MRFDNFTTKAREAIEAAAQSATALGNPELEVEHLLAAILSDPEGSVASVLQRIEADPRGLKRQADALLERLPRVQGG